jgi:hypothetical protein
MLQILGAAVLVIVSYTAGKLGLLDKPYRALIAWLFKLSQPTVK